jgi:hypothetical protein
LSLGAVDALTTYYATQGFTPPGGCAGSTSGALNVIVSLPVPAGAIGLQVKEVSYAIRGTNPQPSTMTITANGVTAAANPQTGSSTCCSSSSCDLRTYAVNVLGTSWYESPCGNPNCAIPIQWYRLPFTTGWYPTNGAGSVGVNIEFGGAGIDLPNFGSGSSFFVSYYANFPSPTPTPSTTSTTTFTPTASTTSTGSLTATATATPTASPSATATPTPSARPTPTSSPTASSSATASSTVSATPSSTKSPIVVRTLPPMSDFTNSTLAAMSGDSEISMATILSGTTVGITGAMAVGLIIQQLRKSGVLNLLRSLGIRVPMDTTVKTEQERRDDGAAENTTLGKAAKLITKVKQEKEKILKTIDSLPLPEEIKKAAHDPKRLLSKSAQKKLQSVENDIEKGLPTPPKMTDEQLEQFQHYMESLGVKVPAKVIEKAKKTAVKAPPEEFDEDDEDYKQALQESQVEIEQTETEEEKEETPVVKEVKQSRRRDSSPSPPRKAMLEVDEQELEDIKRILASKKKDYVVV